MLSREMDPNRGRAGRVLPGLETLEDRCCPSSVQLLGHTLMITDNTGNDTVTIRDGGHGNVTATVDDGHGHRVQRTAQGVQQINFSSRGGNDRIDYALTSRLTTSENINLNLSSGQDTVLMNFLPGISAPHLGVHLNGGRSSDDVTALFGPIQNTNLDFNARLGTGIDHFRALFNGDLTGTAHANFTVQGGQNYGGTDFQIHSNITSRASLGVHVETGPGKDTLHMDYSGKLDGRLSLYGHGGSNFVWLASNIFLTRGSTGSLDAKVAGGAGDDVLILLVNTQGSHLRSLNAQIDGGGGYNIGVHTSNVRAVHVQQ